MARPSHATGAGRVDRAGRVRRPVAVLTGASAGVGRATAKLFAVRGYDVGLLSRGEAGLRAAADDVLAAGGQAVAVKADVAEWQEVRHAAHEVEARLGPVDVWINNAMVTVFGPVAALDPVEIRHVTETTYLGQVHGALAALELMRPRGEGTIVSVSSTLAYRSIPLQAAYCGAKAATRGFLDSLRTELLHDHSGIRVSQVVLPAINTPQFSWSRSKMRRAPRPVAPVYPARAAARAIFDAAERAPRRRVLGSWNRLILVLDKFAPGVLDHATARGSWDGQLVDDHPTEPRPGNLLGPKDDAAGHDAGADGSFAEENGGVLDAAFLRTTPELARTLAGAAADRLREIARLE